jgi:hypothetical protein
MSEEPGDRAPTATLLAATRLRDDIGRAIAGLADPAAPLDESAVIAGLADLVTAAGGLAAALGRAAPAVDCPPPARIHLRTRPAAFEVERRLRRGILQALDVLVALKQAQHPSATAVYATILETLRQGVDDVVRIGPPAESRWPGTNVVELFPR